MECNIMFHREGRPDEDDADGSWMSHNYVLICFINESIPDDPGKI